MKNVILYKLAIFNAVVVSWIAVTNYKSGWLTDMFVYDKSHVSYVILGVFLLALFGTVRESLKINSAWYPGSIKNKAIAYKVFEDSLVNMEAVERQAAWMLFLGLIGTLIGLQISLDGVSTSNFGNVEGIKTIAVQLVSGLRVELSATILGAMSALWAEVNYVMCVKEAKKKLVHLS